jgi:hypothetical protein
LLKAIDALAGEAFSGWPRTTASWPAHGRRSRDRASLRVLRGPTWGRCVAGWAGVPASSARRRART